MEAITEDRRCGKGEPLTETSCLMNLLEGLYINPFIFLQADFLGSRWLGGLYITLNKVYTPAPRGNGCQHYSIYASTSVVVLNLSSSLRLTVEGGRTRLHQLLPDLDCERRESRALCHLPRVRVVRQRLGVDRLGRCGSQYNRTSMALVLCGLPHTCPEELSSTRFPAVGCVRTATNRNVSGWVMSPS